MSASRRKAFRHRVFMAAASCALVLAVGLPPAWATKEDAEPAADNSFSTVPERSGSRKSDSVAVRAVDAALAGKLALSRDLARESGDPTAVKLIEWLYLKDGWRNAGYDRVVSFVAANPGWPMSETLMQRSETLLFLEKGNPARTLLHFSQRRPSTPEGRIALARAELARGDQEAARSQIVVALTDVDLSTTGLEVIRSEFGSMTSQRAYEARLWKLIHAQEVNAALRTAALISKQHVEATQAAAALLRGSRDGLTKYKSLSSSLRNEQALRYALARYYRRAEQYSAASEILLSAPSDHAKLYDPEAWWIERRLVVRGTLGPNNKAHWKTAYKLASAHGYSSGEHFCEGEFLAGWIALRMLRDPKTALKHFSRIGPNALTRTDASRGYYWTGRAYAALGEGGKATAAYRAAAQSPTLYYGQLAREALGLGNDPVPINATKATDAARAEVSRDELVKAFKYLADAGAQRELGLFLRALAARFNTPAEASAVASVVHREGGAFMAVRFAKAASSNGVDIDDWGYPAKALPDWKRMGKPVEKAAVYGLARQESEFNARAVSHAGARGLMQIMPGTAKLIARQHKVSYDEKGLTSNPSYNVGLGAAHLGDLVASYGGSYILTFVAYNAGPRRAREWIAKYGDPRSPNVDAIDWVESVPFTETRKYIQKVMQNVHVYRARLDPKSAMPMSMDLARGSTKQIAGDAGAKRSSCAEEALSMASLISSC